MKQLDTNSTEYKDMPLLEKVSYWRDCAKQKLLTKEMMKDAITYLRENRQEMAVSSKNTAKKVKEEGIAIQGELVLEDLKKSMGLLKK